LIAPLADCFVCIRDTKSSLNGRFGDSCQNNPWSAY
jgi:hypothetical protein